MDGAACPRPQVVGPAVAGVAAALAGWRVAFMILIVPIGIAAVISLKLKEPVRGGTDDPVAAAVAREERPVPFGEARRMLFAVPTLRRQYAAFFFITNTMAWYQNALPEYRAGTFDSLMLSYSKGLEFVRPQYMQVYGQYVMGASLFRAHTGLANMWFPAEGVRPETVR